MYNTFYQHITVNITFSTGFNIASWLLFAPFLGYVQLTLSVGKLNPLLRYAPENPPLKTQFCTCLVWITCLVRTLSKNHSTSQTTRLIMMLKRFRITKGGYRKRFKTSELAASRWYTSRSLPCNNLANCVDQCSWRTSKAVQARSNLNLVRFEHQGHPCIR